MDLLKLGAKLMAQQLGNNTNNSELENMLGSLIGDGDTMDIGSLVAKMQDNDGLGGIVQSWLGDGENSAISASQLSDVLDTERLQQTADQLGTDKNSLLETLVKIVPQIIDNGSNGGSILDSLGGIGGVASLAKGFFK